jgi:hypothetical protein
MDFVHLALGHDQFVDFVLAAGLLFTGLELRHLHKDQREKIKTQQVKNALEIAKSHRTIWFEYDRNPKYHRILDDPVPDLTAHPVTTAEYHLVNILINHLFASYEARKEKLYVPGDALDKDIHKFFSLPIPKSVWETSKELQDPEFVRFIEMNR